MPLEEAIELVRNVEEREHRANEWKRGTLVHEAFETVIKAAMDNEKWHPSLVVTGISNMI